MLLVTTAIMKGNINFPKSIIYVLFWPSNPR